MSFARSGLKPSTVAFIQLGQIGPSKAENLNHARQMILRAAAAEGRPRKPDLVVLPEYFNTPFPGNISLSDFAEDIEFDGKPFDATLSKSDTVRTLANAAKETGTWLIGGSIPERNGSRDDKVFNTCTAYNPKGELVAKHRKVHLFDIDIPGKITFKESDFLGAGDSINYFDTGFAQIGLGICYDVRFPELAMVAARKGCQLLIYPASFTMTTGSLHWEILHKARAVDNQVFFGMCSPARNPKAKIPAWGHSMMVDPMGKVLVEAGEDEEIVYADIDPEVLESARSGIPVTTQRRFDVYKNVAE